MKTTLKKENELLKKHIENLQFELFIQKKLLMISETMAGHVAWYYDLKSDLIYASENTKTLYGHPPDTPPIKYEDFLEGLTALKCKRSVEISRAMCIKEKREIQFQMTGINQNTGDLIDIVLKMHPHVDPVTEEVIGIYGVDVPVGKPEAIVPERIKELEKARYDFQKSVAV